MFKMKNEKDTSFEEFNGAKELEESSYDEISIEDEKVKALKAKAENIDESTILKHEKHYSEDKFWNKIGKFAKKAGTSVVYAVLILFYTLQKPEVPAKAKAIIIGALGYFILPLDLLPDVAFGVGYADDLTVILGALFQVMLYVDDEIKSRAKNKLYDIFGEKVDTSEIDDKIS